MRFQLLIIIFLGSLLAWGVFFMAAKFGYRSAQDTGVVPNLHIKRHLGIEDREM